MISNIKFCCNFNLHNTKPFINKLIMLHYTNCVQQMYVLQYKDSYLDTSRSWGIWISEMSKYLENILWNIRYVTVILYYLHVLNEFLVSDN